MDILGKIAEGTVGILELNVWYIIVGFLISAWSLFYLAAAISGEHKIISDIVGIVIAIGIIWLGIIACYLSSNGFTGAVKISSLIPPITLLTAEISIDIIMVIYHHKQSIVCN